MPPSWRVTQPVSFVIPFATIRPGSLSWTPVLWEDFLPFQLLQWKPITCPEAAVGQDSTHHWLLKVLTHFCQLCFNKDISPQPGEPWKPRQDCSSKNPTMEHVFENKALIDTYSVSCDRIHPLARMYLVLWVARMLVNAFS